MTMNKQSESKRLKARFFKDRPALYKGTRVVYEGNVYGDGHYTAGSIDISVSTSATQNIGKVATSNEENTSEKILNFMSIFLRQVLDLWCVLIRQFFMKMKILVKLIMI